MSGLRIGAVTVHLTAPQEARFHVDPGGDVHVFLSDPGSHNTLQVVGSPEEWLALLRTLTDGVAQVVEDPSLTRLTLNPYHHTPTEVPR